MCPGMPGMKTETIVGWLLVFFMVTSFWVTVLVPENYKNDHPRVPLSSTTTNQDPVKVVILCLERSGSTWLTAMLNQNDGVNVLAEPLHPMATKHQHKADKIAAARDEYWHLVNAMEAVSQNKSLRLLGFNEKLIYPKYALPTQPEVLRKFSNYLMSHNFRMISLRRKNIVFQAISMIRAVQLAGKCGNDAWSKTHERGWQDVCGKHHKDLMLEPISWRDLRENILRAQNKSAELLNTIKQLQLPSLTIYYEDLNENPKQVMQLISNYLGVSLEVKDTLFVKQGDVNIRKMMPNVDDTLRFLAGWDACLIDHVKHFNPHLVCDNLV